MHRGERTKSRKRVCIPESPLSLRSSGHGNMMPLFSTTPNAKKPVNIGLKAALTTLFHPLESVKTPNMGLPHSAERSSLFPLRGLRPQRSVLDEGSAPARGELDTLWSYHIEPTAPFPNVVCGRIDEARPQRTIWRRGTQLKYSLEAITSKHFDQRVSGEPKRPRIVPRCAVQLVSIVGWQFTIKFLKQFPAISTAVEDPFHHRRVRIR